MKKHFNEIFLAVIVLGAIFNAGYTAEQIGAKTFFSWAFLYGFEAVSLLIVFSIIRIYSEARQWFWIALGLSLATRIGIAMVIYYQFQGKTNTYGFWQHEVFSFIIAAAELLASLTSASAEVQLRELLESAKAEMRIAESGNAEMRNRISILEDRLEKSNLNYQIAETHLRNAAAMLGIPLKELRNRARAMTPEMLLPEPGKMADSAEKNGESQAQSIVIQNITQVSASAFTKSESAISEMRIAEPQNESENANPQNTEPHLRIADAEIRIAEPQNMEPQNTEPQMRIAEPQNESENANPQNAETHWQPNPRHGMQAFQDREAYQQTVKRSSTTTTEETITTLAYSQVKMALTDAHIAVLRAAGFSKALPGAVLTNKQLRDFAYTCKTKDNLAAYQEIMAICKDKTLWVLPS